MGTGESFCVYPDKAKLKRTIIMSAIVSAIFAYLAFGALTTPKLDGTELGVRLLPAGFCTFVALLMMKPLLYSWKRLKRTEAEIAIDDDGIFVWMWSDTAIKWSNIQSFAEHNVAGSKMISLSLRDSSQNPARKKANFLLDKNRDFLNWMTRKTESPVSKGALIMASPAAFASIATAGKMPDHRNPVLHSANTDTTHAALLHAIQNRISV
jgi:hypothetical protein